jgi:ABC-type glycerol-3-phosphate transport system substrate-binding protein
MRSVSFNRILHLALLGLALGLSTPVRAQQQVVIVTSFPKELTEAYKKAFEARNAGVKVEILNKPTPAGVAYIREAPASNKPDVFWVSAPDAF